MANVDEYEEAIELNKNSYLHFDDDFKPVELEILDATKVLNIDKLGLKRIKDIALKILISDDKIHVNCEILIPSRNNQKLRSANSVVDNNIKAPPLNLELSTAKKKRG
jgi:hypothetical protein